MTESKRQEPAPRKKRWVLYWVARKFAGLMFHTICPVVYHDREKLSAFDNYILVANHFSNWDPMVAGYAVKKGITFLGKKELVRIKPLKWIFDHLHMIAIDRHNTDMAAMRQCMKALKEGAILGVFPEGTRHHEGIMEEVEDEIALIALRSGVPVIPLLIATKVRPFHVTHAYAGDPIPMDDLKKEGVNKAACSLFIERLKDTYKEMIRVHETRGRVD